MATRRRTRGSRGRGRKAIRPSPARRAAPAQEAAPDDQLASSLAATCAGLERMHAALRASGFAEAAGPYRQMTAVLLQQHQWARAHGRADLDPYWDRLAAVARDVRVLLRKFDEAIQGLESLDREEIR